MKNKKIILLTISTTVLLGALAGFSSLNSFNEKKSLGNAPIENISEESDSKEISKEEILKIKEDSKAKEFKAIEKSVLENVGNYKEQVSVYYHNLDTDVEYTLNPEKKFKGASIRKLGTVLGAADLIGSGKLDKNTLIKYNKETDYEGGSGILQNQKTISPISVEKAIELAMTHSDNIATRMLGRTAGSTSKSIEKITGIPSINNELTSKQAFLLLRTLYDNKNNNPIYDKIISHMKNTIFHDRLDKYLPYENVAHKIGNYENYYHDAGIISSNNSNYILVVMTEKIGETPTNDLSVKPVLKDNYNSSCELIANISKDIYDNLNSLKI